jgi:predicted dehydrogenase
MVRNVAIVMNGVTGRMGTRQHLVRSVLAIREQGGVVLPGGEVVVPEPILLGRNEEKLRSLAEEHGIERWSTDLDETLADPEAEIYFDSQTTARRTEALEAAIEAGKHVYCEKPTATSLDEALEISHLARERGVKNGVVQDKLFLPGLLKLKRLVDGGFFGRILSVRGEFGYWVFDGDGRRAQRPSWNYREEDGGGIILDMLCHWRYVLDNLFGEVESVSCLGATHVPERWDENNEPYEATADDAAYATFELAGDIVAHIGAILSQVSSPVIIHWLGEMFDPALSGYWGYGDLDTATEVCLSLINDYAGKIDGIKVSLLDAGREVEIRRRLGSFV